MYRTLELFISYPNIYILNQNILKHIFSIQKHYSYNNTPTCHVLLLYSADAQVQGQSQICNKYNS